jgi:hypothetical protein
MKGREIETRLYGALIRASLWRVLAGVFWAPGDWFCRLGDRAARRAKRIVDDRCLPR